MKIASRFTAPPTFESTAQAALEALQHDAQQSREIARERRHDAQQREIDRLRQAAAKLHEMADTAASSGWFQGIVGGVAALCQAAGAFAIKDTAQQAAIENPWLVGAIKGGAAAAQPLCAADPYQIANKHLDAERADCETAAKVASDQSQRAADIEQEARRREQKADDMRQQLLRVEDETRKASLGQR